MSNDEYERHALRLAERLQPVVDEELAGFTEVNKLAVMALVADAWMAVAEARGIASVLRKASKPSERERGQ